MADSGNPLDLDVGPEPSDVLLQDTVEALEDAIQALTEAMESVGESLPFRRRLAAYAIVIKDMRDQVKRVANSRRGDYE